MQATAIPVSALYVGVWLLALASPPAAAQIQMAGGGGQVLNTTTEQPVANATVTLECRRSRLGEGSVEVREVRTQTDAEGRYEFSLLQVFGCDFAYVRVSKAGYQDAASIALRYEQRGYGRIPKFRYLTPDEDVVMVRLRAITPTRTGNVFGSDGRPARVSEYRLWYAGFFEAKDIARTERERRFVREHYCETLRALYGALNEEERAEAAKYAVSYGWRGTFRQQDRHDYVADVQAWCINEGAEAPRLPGGRRPAGEAP